MEDGGLRNWIRNEYGKLKALTWKQRFGYIWDYYKPGMVAIIVLIALINIGITMYRNIHTETILSVYFVDAMYDLDDNEELAEQYLDYIGGLEKNQDFVLDVTIALDTDDSQAAYSSQMKFTTYAAAGSIDVCLIDPVEFETYVDMDFFGDLREVLPEEDLEKWADLLIYRTTEEGENYPCALDLSSSQILLEHEMYPEGVYGGISANGKKTDNSSSFFEWLLM